MCSSFNERDLSIKIPTGKRQGSDGGREEVRRERETSMDWNHVQSSRQTGNDLNLFNPMRLTD